MLRKLGDSQNWCLWEWFTAIALAFIGAAGSAPGQDSPSYQAPSLQHPLFSEKPSLEEDTVTAVLSVALLPGVDAQTRGKAVAIAWALSPKDGRVAVIDFNLRHGVEASLPEGTVLFPDATRVLPRLASAAQRLESDGNPEVASALWDLVSVVSDNDDARRRQANTALASLPEVAWSRAFPDQPASSPPRPKASANGFQQRQSTVNGLLVIELSGNRFAGSASMMNATAVPNPSRAQSASTFVFNQSVGDLMNSALREVAKFHSVRHSGIPKGHRVELAFEEQYSSKDGPSAAVACALLLESLITGVDLDSRFAVTGDMNADGTVQPVGGIDGKIRGADHRNCTHVAIPFKNADVLSDLLVSDDIETLSRIQIFTIRDFNQALALATVPESRDEKVSRSLSLFTTIQEVLSRPGGRRMLDNGHVQSRLREVLQLTPNHASARLLLLKAQGQVPAVLTLGGSLINIDRAALPVMDAIQSDDLTNQIEHLKDATFALQRVRGKLDPRTHQCADALASLSTALREFAASKVSPNTTRGRQQINEVRQAMSRVDREYNALQNNPAVQEELQR